MNRQWLMLAILLAATGCAGTAVAPTTVDQNPPSGLDLAGVSLDVHQAPG